MSDTLDISVNDETFAQIDLGDMPFVRVQIRDNGTKFVQVRNSDGEVEETFYFDEPEEEKAERLMAEAEAQYERNLEQRRQRHIDRHGHF